MTQTNKIVRTVCLFSQNPDKAATDKLNQLAERLIKNGFVVQTKRLCSKNLGINEIESKITDTSIILGLGSLALKQINCEDFFSSRRVFFNLDLTSQAIDLKPVEFLFKIVNQKPEKTFNFTYVFNHTVSSPFFPSAVYDKDGFSVGLQPTDLSENCQSLGDWFNKLTEVYQELMEIFKTEHDFLGVDSSIAPLYKGKSSLVNLVKRLNPSFSESVTTDFYLKITNFIKQNNPKPIGLCGLMLPCLEDFELAEEYEKGEFSLERNIFLSLHSGLGIDTYPLGIDENPKRVMAILQLLQGLARKHNKSLSCRFVSDGKAKIGVKTDFKNQYLKDVIVRKI
jgi:hypothetical protein